MKSVIYLRTSTEEQNPELQKKACEDLAQKLNIKEYQILEEQKSAFKDDSKREQFNIVLKEIKKNNIKEIIVWDLDRIYRNRRKLVGFFELCKSFKCVIYSVRQTFLNEIQAVILPEGFDFIKEMMVSNFIQFLGWIAEDESNKKSMRVKNAIRMTSEGAFSYKGNKWGRKEISNGVIKKVLNLKKENPNLSIREIAKQITYYDKNNNSKNLSRSAVHKILTGNHRKIKSLVEKSTDDQLKNNGTTS